jgi:methyl-accepting chemotaxis protein
MSWKNLQIFTKIILGFTIVLIILVVISSWSYTNIVSMINDGNEYSNGANLKESVLQRESDHLKWANKLSQFINNDHINELNIELDSTQCKLGKGYYGNGRKQAESLIPSLKPLLDSLEKPHIDLHNSAVKIKKLYQQADSTLSIKMLKIEVDHLAVVSKVQNAILTNKNQINVNFDHRKCDLGQFMYGVKAENIKTNVPEFTKLLSEIETDHNSLHESFKLIDDALTLEETEQALSIYQLKTLPALKDVRNAISTMNTTSQQLLEGKQLARKAYYSNTTKHLKEVISIFNNPEFKS